KHHVCEQCNKKFTSEKYLSMHMSLHRASTIPSFQNPPDGLWQCKLCDKLFAQNSNYKNHMRTHSNERPYVCSTCSIGFKERYHLKKHILFKHTDEAKEECRVCGKRFKDSTAVRAHERTHSTERPYSCMRCSKSFKTSESTTATAATIDRPFRCDTCRVSFKLKVHLKKHCLYRHSTDYPCECTFCGKKFKDSSAVKLHERIHSDERPFVCACGKGF
ncbi:hypothetical protein HELRODRAFT_133378, partial [Helobdella robusta]|uniref:C2H2-type domain-containing protein n=1 Tax=Helobdella robusta TaxID=6412 RepID=T1EI06_HELRO